MAAGLEHAVVVGGSVAGMLAARALSDHFERVTVLDRDLEPEAAAHRSGVAQSKHLHVLMRGGQLVMEALFPGFERDLERAGSIVLRAGYDVLNIDGNGEWPRRDLGFTNNAQSRPLLEHVIRRRLSTVTHVETRWGCRVDGVLSDASKRRVIGVRYHADGKSHELAANLVIDAAGRQTRSLEWLRELGCPLPEETRLDVDFSYASTLFAIPDRPRIEYKGVGYLPEPPDKRFGALLAIEGGRWMVSLGGRLDDHPPGDVEGFRAFAKSLKSPLLYDAIHDLEPLEPIARFRYPASIKRRFERLSEFPEGLLTLGDALCSFNPVYGQGMTSGALQVEALSKLIADTKSQEQSLDGLWRRFFPRASEIVTTPWTQAGSVDLAYPETGGTRPPNFEFSQQFSRALTQLAIEDGAVHKLLLEVTQLVTPRDAFREPALVERVMQIMQRNAPAVASPS